LKIVLSICVFTIFLSFDIKSQNINEIILNNNEIAQSFDSFLGSIETKYDIKFYYLPEWFSDIKLKKNYIHTSLREALYDILFETEISFVINYNYYIVFYKNPNADIERNKILNNLRNGNRANQVVIGAVNNFVLGKEVTVSGRIRDVKTSEPIIGATIFFKELNKGTITNSSGRYSLGLPTGIHKATISYVNYDSEKKIINVISEGILDIELYENTLTLEDVIVLGEAEDHNVSSGQVGREQLSIEKIKELPTFLGEVDVIKSVQLLPGVTTVGEGAAGFNVRGGSIDQNLVTLDGVQVFNYSHLLGFFSAFNPTTIRDITLYKGGIPAEYGQRLSSILDVKMKDGNTEKIVIKGGLGIVSSNLMIEGPIIKDKTSFLLAGRSTYSDWLLQQVKNQGVRNSSASFFDLNGRITHKINDKNTIVLNGYSSQDRFNLVNDTTYNWSTALYSLKFNHLFNPTLVGNFVLSSGAYGYDVEEPDSIRAFNLKFKVKYKQLAATFEKFKNDHKITFGFQTNLYDFEPGSIEPSSDISNIEPLKLANQKAIENGIFIGDEWQLNSKITIIGGIRATMFSSIGNSKVQIYDPEEPKALSSIIDSLVFKDGDLIKPYYGVAPRFSMRYLITENSSVKLGFNRIYQYIHLISNTTAVTPIDVWQPSNYHIKPQIGDQISLGYFRNTPDNSYEISLETYYKRISNILEYKNGAELILNENLETDLVQGTGRTYGIEFMVKKNKGRLTGWGSYTFSRSESKVESEFREEAINNGKYFPTNFNKPHDVSITTNYKLSLRFAFNVNFTYGTGRPITAPISKYQIDGVIINNYSDRNKYKIPDYHRLDVGFTFKTNHRKNKFWLGEWAISVYNVYGRKNAYSVYFEDLDNAAPQAKKLSILGSPFPSISYNFKF
jgi:hypothetical protein